MPFALVIIGLAMIITGAKDTYGAFGSQLEKDFTGTNNFTIWLAALGGIGSLGYIKALEPISRLTLALVIIVLVVHNGGVFDQLASALRQGPVAPAGGTEGPTTASGSSAASIFQDTANLHEDVTAAPADNSTAKAAANFGTVLDLGKLVGGLFGIAPAF